MSATLRPLTDESGGTCDWGDCDEIAVAERRADGTGFGWLPVCVQHIGRTVKYLDRVLPDRRG